MFASFKQLKPDAKRNFDPILVVRTTADPTTYVPPLGYFTDLLPGSLLFGFGLSIMVAPLTTALMTSVPSRNSGVASAINNAISRVGPQLAGALIFVAITASFYSGLHARVPSVDVDDPNTRRAISPLNVNPPSDSAISPVPVAQLLDAERAASADAFHLAMLIGAGLLAAGAIVNAVAIQNRPAPQPAPADVAKVAA